MNDGKLAKEKVLFAQNKQNKANHSSLGCYALNKRGENPSIDGTGTPLSDNFAERYATPALQCHSTLLK